METKSLFPFTTNYYREGCNNLSSKTQSPEDAAEIMRKKNRYRELILSGRLILSPEKAALLLGPDCMYHLYSINRIKQRFKSRKRQ